MKKQIILVLTLFAMAVMVQAQSPDAIPYQGVARNLAGNIIASQPISLRISIHDLTAAGTVVYSETHAAATTTLGLFNVNIGTGTPITGTLAGVNWGTGAKFIQVELDPAPPSSYINMGTTQLNSVPYALFSKSSSNVSGTATQVAFFNTTNSVTSSPKLNWDNTNGRLGIGIAAPSYDIDVVRNSYAAVRLTDTSPGGGTVWFGTQGGVGAISNHDFPIFTNNTDRMTITAAGKVGIGTSAPSYVLDIEKNDTAAIRITNTGPGGGSVGFITPSNSNAGGIGTLSNHDFPIFTNNTDRMVITAAGNVGINNPSQAIYMLRVDGTAGANAISAHSPSPTIPFGRAVQGVGWDEDGFGMMGFNAAAPGAGQGSGLYGQTPQSLGFGVKAFNVNAIGTAILGIGGSTSGFSLAAGSGGAFTGTTTGVYAVATSTGVGQAIATVDGNNAVRVNYWDGAIQYKIFGGGTVSTIADGMNGEKVTLHCPESPEIYFQDYGVGQLVNGTAHIDIDPIFSKNITVNEKHPLQVFIQLRGDCKGVYTTNETQTGFDVKELQAGQSNVKFRWSITANRADEDFGNGRISKNADARFEKAAPAPETRRTETIRMDP